MNLERVRDEIGGDLKLGSLPKLTDRLRWTLKAEEVDFDRVVEVALLDPPFVARLLRAVNCDAFGLEVPIYDPYQAATILGMNGVSNLIGRTVMLPDTFVRGDAGFDLRDIWRKSILMGRLTAELYPRIPELPKVPKLGCYALGLLADIGEYALMSCLDERWPDLCVAAQADGAARQEREREALGFTHTDLGAMLAARYELPDVFVRATRFHHNERHMAETDPLAALICLTGLLTELTLTESRQTPLQALPKEVQECTGIDDEDLDELATLALRLAEDIPI